MNFIFFIIILVLVFIAYQLFQLNRSKKYELFLSAAASKEEKMREMFPNLYNSAREQIKQEIKDFFTVSVSLNTIKLIDDEEAVGDIIYLERYKIINQKIDFETNLDKKIKMQAVKEEISRELCEWEDWLDSMIDIGKISEWEKSFILWNFLKAINDQFPERNFELHDYFDSKFGYSKLKK